MRPSHLVPAIAIAICVRAAPVDACSVAGATPLLIDPSLRATDTQPPILTVAALSGVQRGRGPQSRGCGGGMASSCDDIGAIRIAVGGTDDTTRPIELGFRASLVDGTPPVGLTIPTEPVVAFGTSGGNEVTLWWIDGSSDDQEAIDFTLAIVAVDHAGNESAPQTVRVFSEGSGGGCSLASRGRSPAVAVATLVVLPALGVRRRRAAARRAEKGTLR